MATRDKLPVTTIWVLVDLGSPQVNALIAVAANRHRKHGAELSVNMNSEQTQALIKIGTDENGFRNALSAAARNAIIEVYNEATHHLALALVTAPGWEPEEE